MSKPVPIDLTRHAQLVEGAREFLRLWAVEGGPLTGFVNPRPLGPDPLLFGVALAEAVGHGARAYARATGIGEAEAAARIWQGIDAERPTAAPTIDPRAAALPDDDEFISYTAPKGH